MDLKTLFETIDIEALDKYVGKASTINIENKNQYTTQINDAREFVNEYIGRSFHDKTDVSKIWDCISHISQIYRQVYFEIGLCAGIKLGHDLHTD